MKTINKSLSLVIAFGALAVCIFMLIGGISLHRSTLAQDNAYTGTVEATVVDYEVHREEMETTDAATDTTRTELVDFYFPVFEYTVDGKDYTTVSDSGAGEKTYEEGSAVTLRYLPDDPSQCFVEGDTTRSFLPYVLYVISLVCLAVSGKTFIDVLKRKG